MSSTEQKNITQPFIDSCFTFGILPTILTRVFDDYALNTNDAPFDGLGETPNLGQRLRKAQNPISEAQLIMPVLHNAGIVTRCSPLLLRLCTDARCYAGNQAVMRFCQSIAVHRWGIHVADTPALRHARLHTSRVVSMLAPGAYSNFDRTARNVNRIQFKSESNYLRTASDVIDYLSRAYNPSKHTKAIRKWCTESRSASGFQTRYRKASQAIEHFRKFDGKEIHSCPEPPDLKQKWFTIRKSGPTTLRFLRFGNYVFIKFNYKYKRCDRSTLGCTERREDNVNIRKDITSELYIFGQRDLEDLRFLLQASAHMHIYHYRRMYDILDMSTSAQIRTLQLNLWCTYLDVMKMCGSSWKLRNKLGVYFDVLQWRYLAWKSGDQFYNHSDIMANKVKSKDLTEMVDQNPILEQLKKVPMDIAIDLLGMYKASIYPEVDPFQVVCDQRRLHYSRHDTNWPPGSVEEQRFEDTKAYMWYFGIRVIHQRGGVWPGRIREGVENKEWHSEYKSKGLPGDRWRDAHDVDLSRCVPVADISNEQYVRQQDSACAPPEDYEYLTYDAMKRAPRRHRRKLLYAIQETLPPDLPNVVEYLNDLGGKLREGHVDPIAYSLPFSVDIVTGSRCERHKDAPRPFYAASPPWGCILSYFDGITRDFLNNVPQSMLGKSTKQKFTDLSSTARHNIGGTQAFYMSDDKAKYSPRMDPRSQQLPADFFSELFGIPAMKACGPIMYHNELYYRVCGHLVHYNSNGTDREGMRGASNTWLEIVAQGLSTRLSRERGLIRGKSIFLSFIDDGLRKFSVEMRNRTDEEIKRNAQLVIDDVIFGLKVLGRELSWDKTFISRDLFVILNEIVYDTSHFSSGLKSFITAGDIELKEVMSAPDYEQLFFGKMRGAHGVGAPLDLCHYVYVFETLLSHFKMGLNLQDNKLLNNLEYRLFCITPVALGGSGLRSALQIGCNEVASATKEGMGNMLRLGNDRTILMHSIQSIMNQPLEKLNPVDFMREPEQFHVVSPRLKTQRLAAEVRKRLRNIASNDASRSYIEQDEVGMKLLEGLGRAMMATGEVSAEEIRLLYASTPVAFIDEFIQKLASSTTLSEIIGRGVISGVRRLVRKDLIQTAAVFRVRCDSAGLFRIIREDMDIIVSLSFLLA